MGGPMANIEMVDIVFITLVYIIYHVIFGKRAANFEYCL